MASIIIASKANSRPLAECEVLAEFLAKNQPQFNYSVIKKHKNEWDDFLTSLTESYGFKRKCCPIVFTVEGELIGDTREFYDYCQNKYGKIVRVGNEVSEPRAKANAQEAKEFVRKRDKGPNLIEKIQKTLRKAKVKKLVSNLEGNFEKIIHNGIPYNVRLTDMSKRSVEFIEEVMDPESEVPEDDGEDKEEGVEEEAGDDNLDYDDLESKEENKEDPTPNEGEGSQANNEDEQGSHPEGEGDAPEEPHPVEEIKEEIKAKPEKVIEEPVSVDDVVSQYPFDESKGMTFEDFEKFYKDEIEGKLNRREAVKERNQRRNGELEEDKEPEEEAPEAHQELDQDPDGEGEGNDGEGDQEAKERREAERQRIEKEREEEEKKRQEEERVKQIEEANRMREEFYKEYVQRRYHIDDKGKFEWRGLLLGFFDATL